MHKFRVRDCWRPLLINCLLCSTAAADGDGLRDALQATLLNHPAVAGQEAEVNARRHAADAVRSQRYPSFTALAQQYAEGDRSDGRGDDLEQPYLLRVRQPIWAFGRIDNSIAVANAEVSTERADLLRVRRQLVEDTAVAYATVRGSQQHIDIARQNVTELEKLSEQIERRVAGQLASSADARLAAARLAEARALLERAISERLGAQDDLVGFTQVAIGTDEPVPAELMELESTGLLETAIDQSAEIGFKRRQLGRAEAEVDRARSAPMPTIYLQADSYYDQPGLNDDNQASVVFEASLEGLGFAARGRTAEAVSSRLAATQDLAVAKVELTREIKGLQRKRQLQTELIGLETKSLSDLESLVASYQRQYESGAKSWLDLLNVERELFEQRHQLVQTQTDWQIYSLQLLARIGGLDGLAGIQERNDG